MTTNEGKALGYQKLKLAKLPQTFSKGTNKSSKSNFSQKSKRKSSSKEKNTKVKEAFKAYEDQDTTNSKQAYQDNIYDKDEGQDAFELQEDD